MTSHVQDAEFPQPYAQSRFIVAVVLPPVLLVAFVLLAIAIVFVGLSEHRRLNATPISFKDTLVERAKYCDETGSIQRSAGVQETRLAALAMQKNFGDWADWYFGFEAVEAADLMREPAGLIVDSFAEEAKPILDIIRQTAESEVPVVDLSETGFSGQQFDLKPYLNVIRIETYAALRAKDSERVLAALQLISGLALNLSRQGAFQSYFWYDSAREFHHRMVRVTLESGVFDDTESIDSMLEQLDAFDRLGSERAGLPSPWKDSWLYDVDMQDSQEVSKPELGERFVRSVLGAGFYLQSGNRADNIRRGNSSQRLMRVALNIKKYQLLKSKFPSQLSDLSQIGVNDPGKEFSDPEGIIYQINSDRSVLLTYTTTVKTQRSSTANFNGHPIQIR